MKNRTRLAIAVLLLLCMPIRLWAQQPYRQYAEEGILLNFFEIGNVDFRAYLLYNLVQDDRFSLLPEEEYGLFVVSPNEEQSIGNFFDTFETFYNNTSASFRLIDKVDLQYLVLRWKECVPSFYFASITMDIALSRATTLNNHCVDSYPFCTSDVIEFQAASSSQTANQLEGFDFDDGCIGSSFNPSWYHMRINTPGQFIIHMEGHDPNTYTDRDIDFCMWGPYTDPTTPCVRQLTTDKIIDCNYSASYSEDIFLGFPEGEHYHDASHGTINFHMPETGEYYILMITNYSQQPCVITFTKAEGSGPGTTDCGILPGIASNDGPYCVGETINLSVNTQAGATYSWAGPNHFSSTLQNPIIPNCTMEMAGTYTCVTTVESQTTSGTTEVIIYPQPAADFSFNAVCEDSPMQFTSTSTTDPVGQEIETLEWDFGDGETANGTNVSHTYSEAGNYEVTLFTSNGNGLCTDQITKTVTVYAIPVVTTTVSPTSVVYGGTATLTANVSTPGTFSYHWEPANMVLNPNSQTTQTVAIQETTVFTVTVTNTDGDCVSTEQATVIMAGSDLTATATADQYEICQNEMTTLHALPVAGTGNYTYNWTPANLLINPHSQNPEAAPPVGSTTFNCTISDGLTTQEVSVTIMVHPNEESDRFEAICENDTYDFFGQILNAPGVYNHTLLTIHGCDSIVHLHLTLNSLNDYTFTVADGENCDDYFWNPQGHEIVYTDHEDPIYTVSGTYHRTYLNQFGCDSLVTMNVDFEYTPTPTDIYPMDPENTAPHWVVTATEFQINSYDFYLWDTNPNCYWDSVTWNLSESLEWVLMPFGDRNTCCKLHVLDHVDDTVWLEAHAFNRCAPQGGVVQRYWLVCSFYGIDENHPSIDSEAFGFEVIPNPNKGQMKLCFERLTGKTEVKVYDMRGTLVDRFETHNGSGSYDYDINIKSGGIYFFVATCKEGTVARKVVIER